MTKKILITGSNGLLGQKLIDLYKNKKDRIILATSKGECRHELADNISYESLDITNENEIVEIIEKFRPDSVINTAAMTNVDACEDDKKGCDALNVNAVEYLVKACNKIDAQLIHLSTDFIFDGKAGPYKETDEANPVSYYGKSKLIAEQYIEKHSKKFAILRTILVYGIVNDMSRSNIVLWAKGALEKGNPIKVVSDQYRMPTLAEDLAMGCYLAEEKNAQGIFNISGKDFMNIYELVERVAKFWNLDFSKVEKANASSFSQTAERPLVTGFDLEKSFKELNYNPHSFEEGLAILKSQLSK